VTPATRRSPIFRKPVALYLEPVEDDRDFSPDAEVLEVTV
jgi:hypothetical protein